MFERDTYDLVGAYNTRERLGVREFAPYTIASRDGRELLPELRDGVIPVMWEEG